MAQRGAFNALPSSAATPSQLTGVAREMTFLSAISALASVAMCVIAFYGMYNVYFHPLRRYPGPRLWAAYRIPYTLYNVQGLLPFKVLDLHRQYGPVVRVAPDELAFTDAGAWEDIQGLRPGRKQNSKDPFSYTVPGPGAGSQIILANDSTHARLRRTYAPAFTPKAVEEQSGMVMKYADLLVEQLKKKIAQEPVQDMWDWYNFTTFDLTGEFAFGEDFHCLDRGGHYHYFVKTVFEGVVTGLQMAQLQRYGLLTLLGPLLPRPGKQSRIDMENYTKELVDGRVERGYDAGVVDVFNYLIRNKDGKSELSRAELYQNAIVLVVAGSETTATLLTAATLLLCQNPEKLRKAQNEVRAAFHSEEEITGKSVNDLAYLLAVLSESMRVFPPTGHGFPRIISSKGGQDIVGFHVPQQTRCGIFHYAAYHYEGNFARPDEFIPERWLTDASPEFGNDARHVLQPFHVGPRGCLGKGLAYAEMRLLLTKMLWHFDFELAETEPNWFGNLKSFQVWERKPLMIRLLAVHR